MLDKDALKQATIETVKGGFAVVVLSFLIWITVKLFVISLFLGFVGVVVSLIFLMFCSNYNDIVDDKKEKKNKIRL